MTFLSNNQIPFILRAGLFGFLFHTIIYIELIFSMNRSNFQNVVIYGKGFKPVLVPLKKMRGKNKSNTTYLSFFEETG